MADAAKKSKATLGWWFGGEGWIRAVALALLLIVVIPLLVGSYLTSHIKGTGERCRRSKSIEHVLTNEDAAGRDLIGDGENAAALAMREGQVTTMAFGRDLTVKRSDIWFSADKELPEGRSLLLDVGYFRRDDDARIKPKRIKANARVVGNQVRLRVCVDRRKPGTADPGTYTGNITFFDRRVASTSVPLTITLSYPFWPWPAVILYLVILIAIPYVYALQKQLKDDDKFLAGDALFEMWKWVANWGGVASIAAGIAGAVAAFVATYVTSADWGSGPSQILGLVGATFTGFVTAATAIHVVAGGAAKADGKATGEKTV